MSGANAKREFLYLLCQVYDKIKATRRAGRAPTLLVFSVTPFKIDQKVQILGKEIYAKTLAKIQVTAIFLKICGKTFSPNL